MRARRQRISPDTKKLFCKNGRHVLFPNDGMNSFDLQIALVLTFVAPVTLLVLSVWWASTATLAARPLSVRSLLRTLRLALRDGGGKAGTGSGTPSITFAFAPASRLA